jgi:TatD DNase family protein
VQQSHRTGPAPDPVDRPVWVDNHCHLDGEGDVDAVLADAAAAGVAEVVCVGVTVARSAECVALARSHRAVWATAGVHPHDARHGIDGLEDVIEEGLAAGVLVAVGECGLDHHYDNSPRDVQREAFAAQIAICHRRGLPLVIHTREAWDDTFDVLDGEGVPDRTVFHCFTGGPEEARRALDRGALLSVSGIVTFPGAPDLRDAVALAPLDRLMVETDSPYLAPVPHRGRRNRPALVARVGEEVAALQGRDVAEVAAATTATARAFYGMRPR